MSIRSSGGANSGESRLPNFRLIKLSPRDIKFCRCCSRNCDESRASPVASRLSLAAYIHVPRPSSAFLRRNAFENSSFVSPAGGAHLELAEIREASRRRALIGPSRGFSPVNGATTMVEETDGMRGGRRRKSKTGTEVTPSAVRAARGGGAEWRKKLGENAKCNPRSRRGGRGCRVQQRRQETMQPSRHRYQALPPLFLSQPRCVCWVDLCVDARRW